MAEDKDYLLASATDPLPNADPSDFAAAHELPAVFAAHGLALNTTLVGMLNEHFSHRTERRGSGYTQATRHLAVLVNHAQADRAATVGQLFAREERDSGTRRIEPPGHPRDLSTRLEREESRLLASIIADLVEPCAAAPGKSELRGTLDEIKVGTCPLAEKYFLEISEGFVRRKGRIDIWVSDSGQPLLIEKANLGDSFSCISVAELMLNGVRLPPGCLFGVKYDPELVGRANRKLPGKVLFASQAVGFKFLRLTTLAVSPANRQRAFTSHFQSQVDAGLFAPREATIEQLRRVAEAQL